MKLARVLIGETETDKNEFILNFKRLFPTIKTELLISKWQRLIQLKAVQVLMDLDTGEFLAHQKIISSYSHQSPNDHILLYDWSFIKNFVKNIKNIDDETTLFIILHINKEYIRIPNITEIDPSSINPHLVDGIPVVMDTDSILNKISKNGYDSLTKEEKMFLDKVK